MTTSEIVPELAADALRFLTDPSFREDPEDFYARARAEGPVFEVGGGVVLRRPRRGRRRAA